MQLPDDTDDSVHIGPDASSSSSSGKYPKFSFGMMSHIANKAADKYRDAVGLDGTPEKIHGDENAKSLNAKFRHLFRQINDDWTSHSKSEIAQKYPMDFIASAADGFTLKYIYPGNVPIDAFKKIAKEFSKFLLDVFGLRPNNWKFSGDSA